MLSATSRSLVFTLFSAIAISAPAQDQATNPMQKNFVRVWEGKRQSGVSMDIFTDFLTQVLFVSTITANESLLAYIPVVLNDKHKMPEDAFLTESPFDEAALVVHRDEASYNESRRVNPWYGPQHFVEGAGFDPQNSYSAVPQDFKSTIEFASRENRVAYDLRAKPFGNPDWQSGRTLVSVILRKKNVSDEDFSKALAEYSAEIRTELAKQVDGHFLRAGPGHALEYLRFNGLSAYAWGRSKLNSISKKYEAVLITDFYRSLAFQVEHGKATAVPGLAINIKFKVAQRAAAQITTNLRCDQNLSD